MKRILALSLAIIMLLAVPAGAVLMAYAVHPSLTFSNSRATCKLTVSAETGDQISATVSLYHGAILLDSWSEEGTTALTLIGTHEAERGNRYLMVCDVEINGNPIDVDAIIKPYS